MQLEKRQPGSIAELAARPVTIKLPTRDGEQHDIVLVDDLIRRSGLGGPLRLEEKRGFALGDVFRSQGDVALWGFEYSARFFGGEGSRYSRLGVEGCCHGLAGPGDVSGFGIEGSGWCVLVRNGASEVEALSHLFTWRGMASSYEVCAGTAPIGCSPWHLRLSNHIVPCAATWTMHGHVGCQQRKPGYIYAVMHWMRLQSH